MKIPQSINDRQFGARPEWEQKKQIKVEIYNNTKCITYAELTAEGVMTVCNYQNMRNRKTINVVRRGCFETPALIEWRSIPEKYKARFIKVHGYDPGAKEEETSFNTS